MWKVLPVELCWRMIALFRLKRGQFIDNCIVFVRLRRIFPIHLKSPAGGRAGGQTDRLTGRQAKGQAGARVLRLTKITIEPNLCNFMSCCSPPPSPFPLQPARSNHINTTQSSIAIDECDQQLRQQRMCPDRHGAA